MATVESLSLFEPYFISKCLLYEPGLISPFFIGIDFFPTLLTIGFFSLSLYITDIYLFLFSISLSFHILVNIIIRVYIIAADNRFVDCGTLHQMPSLSSDHAVFFVTVMITFIMLWRRHTASSKIVMLNFFILLVLFARVFLGINTLPELFFGLLHGFGWAIIYQLLIYFIFYPYFNTILSFWLFKWFGFKTVLIQMPRK